MSNITDVDYDQVHGETCYATFRPDDALKHIENLMAAAALSLISFSRIKDENDNLAPHMVGVTVDVAIENLRGIIENTVVRLAEQGFPVTVMDTTSALIEGLSGGLE